MMANLFGRRREAQTVPTSGPTVTWGMDMRLLARELAALSGSLRPAPDPGVAAELITGRRVLITGAGGSIGSELTRQVRGLAPSRLLMLDRDESALQELQLGLDGSGLLDTPETLLRDIRDAEGVDEVFAEFRPQVVLHAAALKHLPLLQRYPREAWMTNVHGTRNVLDSAVRYDAEHVVNVSTDKAADPQNVLGRSKRLAEALTAHAAAETGRPYVSVRFGNVLGSRGSVVPTFVDQVRRGGPLTVTHPEVTRFVMTIPEACSLVLTAAALGNSGETLILDMGAPVRMVDIATTIADLAGVSCPIVYTGLRPGEKLHEDLHSVGESGDRTEHAGIMRVHCPPLDPVALPGPEDWGRSTRELLLGEGPYELLPDVLAELPISSSPAVVGDEQAVN